VPFSDGSAAGDKERILNDCYCREGNLKGDFGQTVA